jgi:transposase
MLSANSNSAVQDAAYWSMSLKPAVPSDIPELTQQVARAAFPKGCVAMRLRDEFGTLYQDADFADLFPKRGQPALPAWRLALVTVLQFLENVSDRQAANHVRGRIDWKYALGLELHDAGFHFSVLSEFRAWLVNDTACLTACSLIFRIEGW